MSTWKPALISAPIAVTFMVHCKNAKVQLQLVEVDDLKLFNRKAREANKYSAASGFSERVLC